jgi:hypothetical protein
MKRPLLLTLSALSVVALTTLQSYKNGPAENNTQATNAPGSSANKCTSCHGGGSFGAVTVDFSMISDSGIAVTEYTPGATYTLNVRVNNASGTPAGFGLQAVALKDSDNNNAGDFTNPSANAQIMTLSGRKYFEHNNTSAANEFTCEWTAPAATSGAVTFYFGANAVNGNNATNGDNAVLTDVTFQEAVGDEPDGIFEMAFEKLSVFPNPAKDVINIEGISKRTAIEIYALNGTKVSETISDNGKVDITNLPSGLFIVKSGNKIARILKL